MTIINILLFILLVAFNWKALKQRYEDRFMAYVPENFIHLAVFGAPFCAGTFAYYFKLLLTVAKHLKNGYHNLTHTLYVVWQGVLATAFYVARGEMTIFEARYFIIALIFHDWNHSGTRLKDELQLEVAYAGLDEHVLPEDRPHLPFMRSIIGASEYPPKEIPGITLFQLLMREIDSSQALQQTWLQQVIYGLAQEWEEDPLALVRKQHDFLSSLKYVTVWGKLRYEPLVARKLRDVELLEEHILGLV